ncbi:MAG: aminotransferase class V-fold PLP-dependent enzyme [Acidimicrobiales bacterium]
MHPLDPDPAPDPDPITRWHCERADAVEATTSRRARFELPPGVIHLDGNSLGPLAAGVAERVAHTVRHEWGVGLIRSWNDAGWIDAPRRLGARLAPLLGADADEVVVCDSTSMNLVKAAHAALSLRPARTVLLTEDDGFPTDRYLLTRIAADRGLRLVTAPAVEVAAWVLAAAAADGARQPADGAPAAPAAPAPATLGRLDPADVALVALGHVDYRDGTRHDLGAVTAAAHRLGALVLWDLAHSAGVVPLRLGRDAVDFAVGCTYKYLNGGPGSPAFVFVARRWHDRLDHPLVGWMGHARPFAFAPGYDPAPGPSAMLTGTPPILAFAALEAALEVFDGVDLEALFARQVELSALALRLLSPVAAAHPELRVASPLDPAQRGAHLALRHPEALAVSAALIERGVIGDFRPPDLLRWAFAPLYVRRVDVFDAVAVLADVLDRRSWDDERHRRARTVT